MSASIRQFGNLTDSALGERSVEPSKDAPPRSAPAFYRRRKKRANEICQLLLRNGDVQPEQVRRALRIQEERGGQIGRILVKMGACSERAIARALLKQVQIAHESGERRASALARENPAVAGLEVVCRPALTVLTLFGTDMLVLAFAAASGSLVVMLDGGALQSQLLYALAPLIVLGAAFPMLGLYTGIAPSPPDELRLTTCSITLAFLGVGTLEAIACHGQHRWLVLLRIGLHWALAVLLVPLGRSLVRGVCSRRPWWGHPAVILGAGKTGRLVVRTLRERPHFGLKPVMMLDDDAAKHGTLRASWTDDGIDVHSTREPLTERAAGAQSRRGGYEPAGPQSRRAGYEPAGPESLRGARGCFAEVEGVPVIGGLELAAPLASKLRIPYAIVAMPGLHAPQLLQLTERVGGAFSHLLVIPDLFGLASLGVPARDVGGVLGIELRQQLLLPGPRLAKRVMDLVLTLLGGLLVLPVVAVLALLIKLDSPGPVFYPQPRLGRDGRRFVALKFRTMYGDGEQRLAELLASNATLRAEYEEFHKLSRDPRVTRVGRVVRKYSLDELPQLWNVLRGEMSLVGPRPYLEREIPAMGGQEGVILRAMPGMTGMWQVTDRNATGFAERLKMDIHYVRNWSPWLDIYLLARTVRVVLAGTGS